MAMSIWLTTCKLMIWDLVVHVAVHHLFECVFGGKNIVPPHGVVCTIFWLKRQPNIFIWSILHGLGHLMIIKTSTIILTKDIHVKIIYVCEGNLKNKRKWMEHHTIPTVIEVVLLMGFLYPFEGVSYLCMFHSTWVSTSFHLLSKNSHTCACAMYAILIDILFVPPCFTLEFHTKSTFEKKDFVGLLTWIDCDLGIQPMLINL